MKKKGLSPVLCNAGSNAVHHHYFGCPVCGSEVGGFTIGVRTKISSVGNADRESTGVM